MRLGLGLGVAIDLVVLTSFAVCFAIVDIGLCVWILVEIIQTAIGGEELAIVVKRRDTLRVVFPPDHGAMEDVHAIEAFGVIVALGLLCPGSGPAGVVIQRIAHVRLYIP